MRIGVVVLGLWTALLIGLSVRFSGRMSSTAVMMHGSAMEGAASATDERTAIQLPAPARDAVLAEMRQMLTAVQGVLDGANRGDTAAIRAAASKAGTVMAADPGLMNMLPKSFMQFGMTAHLAFDTLASEAGAGSTAAIARLASITATCVACHAAYRIEVKP